MADSKVAIGETVIVEGSLSPAMGYLKRGEQAEVPYSENIADLHRKGFLIVRGKPTANPVTPVTPVAPDQSVPTVPSVKPDQSVPSVPNSGTNQDLAQATPVQAPDQTKPEVANPEVDNNLIDSGAAPGTAKTATTSTSTVKK
jgi:hypothetical protein